MNVEYFEMKWNMIRDEMKHWVAWNMKSSWSGPLSFTKYEVNICRIIRSFEAWSHHEMSLYHLRSTKSTFARFHSAMISSSCKREFLMLTWNLKAKQRQHAVSEGTWNPACLGQMASSIFSVSSLKVSAGLLEDFSFFGLNLRDALVLSLYEFFAIIPALVD